MGFRKVIVDAYVPEHGEFPPFDPPGIWGPTDPRPTPPIHIPGPGERPPGTWGGAGEPFPTPPIVIPPDFLAPGVPAHPIYLPVYPAHPIVIPPGAIGPGKPTHPIVLPPPRPAHPIVLPPDSVAPGVPAHPIVLPPYPAHPIVLPPDTPPDQGEDGYPRWVYTVPYGWVLDPGPGGKPQPPKK